MQLTAKSKSGVYKQLYQYFMDCHNKNDEVMADKLYKLSEDVLYDDYLSMAQIKAKFLKIIKE